MAKRARGSVRPGQRRPIDRRTAAPSGSRPAPAPTPAASPAPAQPRSAGLTDAETARAAELEQQLLEQERQAEAARSRAQERSTREVNAGGSSLAVRAEQEYAYVARDVRRIGEMAVLMLVILFGLWFAIDVLKVITIA
jgi:hypothetical protein